MQQSRGVSRNTVEPKKEISSAEFNGWKLNLPQDPAAALDVLLKTIQGKWNQTKHTASFMEKKRE